MRVCQAGVMWSVADARPTRQSLFRRERFQAFVQAALVAGGLVGVDDAFADHRVDDRSGLLVGGRGLFGVAGVEGADGP